MRFFFTWIDPQQQLVPDDITKTDLDILDFSITQREGEIALCQLTIPLSSKLPQQYAVLFVEIGGKRTPLFKGRLMELPLQINDWQQRIELSAMPVDAQEQLHTLKNQIQETIDWDELFVDEASREDPVEALEAIPSLFCWHPVTHQVVLSDLFQGKVERKYDETQILQNSLAIKIANLPKPYINVSLVAEWIQEAQGEINIFPLIEKEFEGGKINTLTSKGILSSWPRAGQLLGRSGYAVVKSNLVPLAPRETGILDLYPQVTPSITFTEETAKTTYIKRSWFEGSLKLDWHYRQRRREIVNFKLTQQNQLVHRTESKKLDLTLKLADISKDLPSASSDSFFETERGKKAVAHAIKIARCHLALSARGLEATFKVPFEEALSLTLDESIQICHRAFLGGKATGKLVSYKLSASFGKVIAELKVAITTGVGEIDLPTSIDLTANDPLAGLPEPEKLIISDFVEAICVKNQSSEQIKLIQQARLNNIDELKKLLGNHQTEIALRLKDIRSVDVLERQFYITTPLIWSAPCQIKIGEANEVSSEL